MNPYPWRTACPHAMNARGLISGLTKNVSDIRLHGVRRDPAFRVAKKEEAFVTEYSAYIFWTG
jgi:hypothetical protein